MPISTKNIKRVSVARGAVLVVGMRWTDRLIGVISTLILARLLLPSDFGVVAMASVVVGFIDTLLDLGVGSSLVQNKDAGREEFDTAWTLRLLQAALASVLLWLLAPMAGDYFHDPRTVDVVRVMALGTLVGGFENIGIVAFQKNMEFGRDFQFFFFRRIAGFTVTTVLAVLFRSYWAMVVGAIVGRGAGVLISYYAHDYRPRFSVSRAGTIWSYSQWILVRNIGAFGARQLDKFLIGQRCDAGTMGAYTLADEVSSMPTTEILAPLGRILFPVFVESSGDRKTLQRIFAKAIGIQSIIAMPASVGMCLIAADAVELLFGPKWHEATLLIQILTLIGFFSALCHSSGYLLLALGKVKQQAILPWIQLIVQLVLATTFFSSAGATGIAIIRLITEAATFLIYIMLAIYFLEGLSLKDYVRQTYRPFLATGAMTIFLYGIPSKEDMALSVHLFFSVTGGASIYALTILTLWALRGCPDGAELYLLTKTPLRRTIERFVKLPSNIF